MNILDLKKINIIVLSMLLFLSMQIPVFASEPVTEVKIPVEQVVEGEAQDQAAEFSYVLTTNQNEAPMPKGSKEKQYVWSMKKKETAKIIIPITTDGTYHYQIYQTTEQKDAYECDQSHFDVSVEAFYNEANQLKTVTVVKNPKGEKTDQITFLNRLNKTEQSNKTSQSVAKEKVKTGDNSTIWGYILLLVISILYFVIFFYEKQKRKKGEVQDGAE